jgi:hypothetical protein
VLGAFWEVGCLDKFVGLNCDSEWLGGSGTIMELTYMWRESERLSSRPLNSSVYYNTVAFSLFMLVVFLTKKCYLVAQKFMKWSTLEQEHFSCFK